MRRARKSTLDQVRFCYRGAHVCAVANKHAKQSVPRCAPARTPWRLGLLGCVGCASRQGVRSLRGKHRHRALRAFGRASHEPGAVQHRSAGLLGHGQRLVASWRGVGTPPHASPSKLVPVHGPVHASWLIQIEIYFSIVQRKVLTPNDFPCLEAVAERLANFERHFESIARPFEWKFTRNDLNALIARMRDRWARDQPLKLAA